ncbi:MAG: HlyD family efflux transporter periplasmic adaptor subunit [Balneolaceae bacterium]|nr:MAG: HlyD family efflux transporter periplasmic adaptor subunit [Balneolaceae bacterium]
MERLNQLAGFFIIFALTTGCTEEKLSDAYGQFEATELVISAETQGRILAFNVMEGERLEEARLVGIIDTTQQVLQKRELEASMRVVQTGIANLDAQKDVLHSRHETALIEFNRLKSLFEDNAATRQQLDRAQGEVNTLHRQIRAIETEKLSVSAEMERIGTKIDQVNDQIRRAEIINPVNGTVLTKFAHEHELAAPGKPMYRLANLDEMVLKVYVSGAQLPRVKIGESVEVLIDRDKTGTERLTGIVSWVSSRAEFTPRMIQTREERVAQVYAVKVTVENPEGKIKIGMPGEVNF